MTVARTSILDRAFVAGTIMLMAVATGIGLQGSSISAAPVSKGAEAMRALPKNEQLARAFATAFDGGRERVALESGGIMIYRPGALTWTSVGALLISPGTVDRPGPDDSGALAIHYLRPQGTTFKVTGAYPNAIEGNLTGGPPKWQISAEFGDNPVIVSETSGSWQGAACTTIALYELGGGEPVSLGAFRSGYDNAASEGQGPLAVSITGSIRNIVKGQSFEVHFDGTSRFKQFFARQGAGYVKAGGDGELPSC